MTGYATGDHNRLTADGEYTYTYDNKGNVLTRSKTGEHITYTWDHRNRLTKVTFRESQGGPITKTVEYAYDAKNRMYSRVVDETTDTRTICVHDESNQMVLDLEDDNVGDVASSDLKARRLWHPQQTDHAITEEQLGQTDHLYWTLLDHLNSVRDVVQYDSGSVSVVKHVVFDAFGQVVSDTAPGVVLLPGYTGKLLDPETGLQYNINRWYDASVGRWMSVDPIGFEAADANLYRYVNNGVTWQVDPEGTCPQSGLEVRFSLEGLQLHVVHPFLYYTPGASVWEWDTHHAMRMIYRDTDDLKDVYRRYATPILNRWEDAGIEPQLDPNAGHAQEVEAVTMAEHALKIDIVPHKDEHSKCGLRIRYGGYVLALVDPRLETWKHVRDELKGSQLYFDIQDLYGGGDHLMPEHVIEWAKAHEMDHYRTNVAFHEIATYSLQSLSNDAFDNRADAIVAKMRILMAFKRLAAEKTAHSKSFDTAPWNTGGRYADHPFAGEFSVSK